MEEGTEVVETSEEDDDFSDVDVDSLLEPETPKDPLKLDWENPDEALTALSTAFKEKLGVDLKEAIESYQLLVTEAQSLQQMREEMEAERNMQSLRTAWGVNDQELTRRVAVLNKFAEQKPDVYAKYDSLEGIQTLWDKLQKQKAKATGGSARTSNKAVTGSKRYKQSELDKLMFSDPAKYSELQADLMLAYDEGRVDP